MEDKGNEEKMAEIVEVIDAMPESVDEEFLCNLFANAIMAYGHEDSALIIFMVATQLISEKVAELKAQGAVH